MSSYSVTPTEEASAANNSEFDAAGLQRMMADIRSKQSLLFAILGGLAASIIAAILWTVISYASGYRIGFMAIGVGFLVGYAVKFAGKGLDVQFGVVGALLSFFGCLVGNLLTAVIFASLSEGISILTILGYLLTAPGIILEIMKETFRPMDLLFYGIAIYEGYRFSFYELSEEELASLRKDPIPPPVQIEKPGE